jgi:hypothetical protein
VAGDIPVSAGRLRGRTAALGDAAEDFRPGPPSRATSDREGVLFPSAAGSAMSSAAWCVNGWTTTGGRRASLSTVGYRRQK